MLLCARPCRSLRSGSRISAATRPCAARSPRASRFSPATMRRAKPRSSKPSASSCDSSHRDVRARRNWSASAPRPLASRAPSTISNSSTAAGKCANFPSTGTWCAGPVTTSPRAGWWCGWAMATSSWSPAHPRRAGAISISSAPRSMRNTAPPCALMKRPCARGICCSSAMPRRLGAKWTHGRKCS